MQTSEVAAQALTLLAPVVSGGARWAQGVATKTLGDMISQRLSRSAEGREAWDGFRSNPHNDSLVHHLLRQEMSQDGAFSAQVAEQLRKAEEEARQGAVHQSIGNNGSGNVQAGRDISGKVATDGGTILDNVGNTTTTMHNRTSTTHNKKKSSGGAVVGVVAIVVVVVLALVIYGGVKIASNLLKSTKDGGLTASSTCQQFLNTDEDDERQALADIGISYGFSEYSNPLALPEIQYECGGQPSTTLGSLIQRDGANT
jgi:hypothetical protein